MAALRPPVPPRPHSSQANPHDVGAPPPIPPLPPNFRPDLEADNEARYSYGGYDSTSAPPPPPAPGFYPPPPQIALDAGSAPHYADPLVAPRPQRLTPDVPADVSVLARFIIILLSSSAWIWVGFGFWVEGSTSSFGRSKDQKLVTARRRHRKYRRHWPSRSISWS